jgi:hypothetical protein
MKKQPLANSPAVPTDAPLSPQWAFVVQFRATTAEGPVFDAGRVEHLVSGRTAHFHSLEELSAFFSQTLGKRRVGKKA